MQLYSPLNFEKWLYQSFCRCSVSKHCLPSNPEMKFNRFVLAFLCFLVICDGKYIILKSIKNLWIESPKNEKLKYNAMFYVQPKILKSHSHHLLYFIKEFFRIIEDNKTVQICQHPIFMLMTYFATQWNTTEKLNPKIMAVFKELFTYGLHNIESCTLTYFIKVLIIRQSCRTSLGFFYVGSTCANKVEWKRSPNRWLWILSSS